MRLIPANFAQHVEYSPLTLSEQVQASCTIAREKLELGDYDAGCAALQPWWTIGEWPKQGGLSQLAAAELLLTAGTLSGWVAILYALPCAISAIENLNSGESC